MKLKLIVIGTGRDGTLSLAADMKRLFEVSGLDWESRHEYGSRRLYNLYADLQESGNQDRIADIRRIFEDCEFECVVGNGYAFTLSYVLDLLSETVRVVHLKRKDRAACIRSFVVDSELFPAAYGYYSPLTDYPFEVRRTAAFHLGEMGREAWDALAIEEKFGWYYDATHAQLDRILPSFRHSMTVYTEDLNRAETLHQLGVFAGLDLSLEQTPLPRHLNSYVYADVYRVPSALRAKAQWLFREFDCASSARDDLYPIRYFVERFITWVGYLLSGEVKEIGEGYALPAEQVHSLIDTGAEYLVRTVPILHDLHSKALASYPGGENSKVDQVTGIAHNLIKNIPAIHDFRLRQALAEPEYATGYFLIRTPGSALRDKALWLFGDARFGQLIRDDAQFLEFFLAKCSTWLNYRITGQVAAVCAGDIKPDQENRELSERLLQIMAKELHTFLSLNAKAFGAKQDELSPCAQEVARSMALDAILSLAPVSSRDKLLWIFRGFDFARCAKEATYPLEFHCFRVMEWLRHLHDGTWQAITPQAELVVGDLSESVLQIMSVLARYLSQASGMLSDSNAGASAQVHEDVHALVQSLFATLAPAGQAERVSWYFRGINLRKCGELVHYPLEFCCIRTVEWLEHLRQGTWRDVAPQAAMENVDLDHQAGDALHILARAIKQVAGIMAPASGSFGSGRDPVLEVVMDMLAASNRVPDLDPTAIPGNPLATLAGALVRALGLRDFDPVRALQSPAAGASYFLSRLPGLEGFDPTQVQQSSAAGASYFLSRMPGLEEFDPAQAQESPASGATYFLSRMPGLEEFDPAQVQQSPAVGASYFLAKLPGLEEFDPIRAQQSTCYVLAFAVRRWFGRIRSRLGAALCRRGQS